MNVEKLKLLRDKIAGLPKENTDLTVFHAEDDCGTVCCIAGWAAVAQLNTEVLPLDNRQIVEVAREFVEARELEEISMFFSSSDTTWDGKTEALSRIDFAIKHDGDFDWEAWMETIPEEAQP